MPMNPLDSTPERPRDIIDDVEDLCAERGCLADVSPDYYDAFLTLSDVEMEVLARAALNSQAKCARRLTFAEPAAEAPARLIQLASSSLSVIAIGSARINVFAKYGLYKRVGPEPEPDVYDALMAKIAKARSIIEQIVRDFIQQQHDASPGADSAAAKQPPVPPGRYGWQKRQF